MVLTMALRLAAKLGGLVLLFGTCLHAPQVEDLCSQDHAVYDAVYHYE